jgi:hypothetical protein
VCAWQQQDVNGGRGGGPDNLFDLNGSSLEGKLHNEYEHVFTAAAAVAVWVVGQIIPWNFPLLMAAWKVGGVSNCNDMNNKHVRWQQWQ